MKHAPYMASEELKQLMWLSTLVQALDVILIDKTTVDKDWRRWLKTAQTLVSKVTTARIADLNQLEVPKVYRRMKKARIKVYTIDDARVDKEDTSYKVTFSKADFMDLLDAAQLHCYSCPQGNLVKDCPRRKLFHRLGLQVYQLRENPGIGECEWRWDNEQRYITPQYERLPEDKINQLP